MEPEQQPNMSGFHQTVEDAGGIDVWAQMNRSLSTGSQARLSRYAKLLCEWCTYVSDDLAFQGRFFGLMAVHTESPAGSSSRDTDS